MKAYSANKRMYTIDGTQRINISTSVYNKTISITTFYQPNLSDCNLD
jgi:hypothetical protein